ncbi:rRNA pseudouridine synthase [Vagococcus lutrae]|uniref:Pseudouridine synthase n=2 Tax=Vagococcus lutrae TaxID=81947 RepID=V6Q7K4_9ENTE|nr:MULTISPECIES: pseudouridine synthase [Vagococcus]EST90650.1 16S rRNA pseudouridine synthase A [Vagococcus lutrae LBD1]MCO7151472.1 rRNA pseudouridine synthase [Vagococcus lutrae]MDO5742447.1 pseudouridine synthase [Vagococcus sp.]MDT2806582.1 pseudouridine synthase [Vagococcus lutrae]MDT2808022.1 pseudouridine synthase [Vagococcus lutrae]
MERLQKVMAQSGVASRRKSEQLILEGKVKVNGKKVTELGTKVSKKDTIEVNGVPVLQEEHVYFMLYKPRGYISAVTDDKGRETVVDLLPGVTERIFPVGRLDYDTSGLILLTNDGEFTNQLNHPRHEVDKVYVAKVKGVPTNAMLSPLKKGVKIDGRMTAPARYEILSTDRKADTAIVSLTIHEGRNHQVKKMLKEVGFPVMKLKREQYGNLTLKGLKPGQYRSLSQKEVRQLLDLSKEG